MRGNQIVLNVENGFGTEGALEGLGPEVSAGDRVGELHRQPQFASRLPQSAFHHVARAKLLANGAQVGRLIYIFQRRPTSNHAQIREPRQPSNDLFRKSISQRGQIGIRTSVFERQFRAMGWGEPVEPGAW